MSETVLHYEIPSRRRRLGKRAVWVLVALVAIGAALITWHRRERIQAQFEAISHQRLIAEHRVPEDRVLYESPELDDSAETTMREYQRVTGAQPRSSKGFDSYVAAPQTVPYMGIRSTPAGEQRIVIINELFLQVRSGSNGYNLQLSYEIHEPGTYLKLPQAIRFAGSGGGSSVSHPHGPPDYPPLVVYVGQPDSADPTRINFRFVSDGRDGVITLRLGGTDHLEKSLELAEP